LLPVTSFVYSTTSYMYSELRQMGRAICGRCSIWASLSAYHRPNEAPECGFICRAPEAVHFIYRDIQTTPRYTWIHTF